MFDRLFTVYIALNLTCAAVSVAYQSHLSRDATEEAVSHCAERNMSSGSYKVCLDRTSLAGKAY
jgi:hypothetical protein